MRTWAIVVAVPEIVVLFVSYVLFLIHVFGAINSAATATCENKQYQQSYQTGKFVFHTN